MTSENILSKYEGPDVNFNFPFLLKPAIHDQVWGGRRLIDDFNKDTEFEQVAESWECSVHPDGFSIVSSGIFKGLYLRDVLKSHPELAGEHHASGDIPILVKLIDAAKDQPVRVFSEDVNTNMHANECLGKTKLWYVLDASMGAMMVHGFHHDIDETCARVSILRRKLQKYLRKVPVRKNDVFFIEPGVVHALGSGSLIVEIQESTNLTYQLYDYYSADVFDNKKKLHLGEAIAAANLKATVEPNQPMRVLRYQPGYASELLCRCRCFQVERIMINTDRVKDLVEYQTDSLSFRILLCIDGCGTIFCKNSDPFCFFKGDCVFVPANSVSIKLHGKAQFLNIGC